jgi:hypothetical protein
MRDADIAFMPYNYIIDKSIRDRQQVPWALCLGGACLGEYCGMRGNAMPGQAMG